MSLTVDEAKEVRDMLASNAWSLVVRELEAQEVWVRGEIVHIAEKLSRDEFDKLIEARVRLEALGEMKLFPVKLVAHALQEPENEALL